MITSSPGPHVLFVKIIMRAKLVLITAMLLCMIATVKMNNLREHTLINTLLCPVPNHNVFRRIEDTLSIL